MKTLFSSTQVSSTQAAIQTRIFRGALFALNLFTFSLLPHAALAATDPQVDNLNQLVTQNKFQDAYTLSKQMQNEYEGEPDYDFLFGLAALETGHPNEAVFALERVAYSYPKQQRVKLELARAYFQTNNLGASRSLFNEVLATNPSDNVKTNIQAFLDRIDQRERSVAGTFSWYVTTNVGADSNINSATELGVISTPIGDVTLSSNGQSISDNFMDVGTGVSYVKPLSKTTSVNFDASYNLHNNLDTNAFDLGVLAADASYSHVVNDMRLSYGGRLQRVTLDGDLFQKSASLLANLQRRGSDGWTQGLTGAYTRVRYDNSINANANLRDVNQWLVSGMLGRTLGKFNHSLSVYYGNESAVYDAGKDNAQKFFGLGITEQFQLSPRHIPYITVSYRSSDNKAPHVFFGKTRNDGTYSASLGWVWRASNKMNVTTDLTYTRNNSNLDLYGYNRTKFQTGLRYQF